MEKKGDILFFLSTGGGDKKSKASMNLISAANEGRRKGLKIISLIGKGGGELKKFPIYIYMSKIIIRQLYKKRTCQFYMLYVYF